MITIGLIETYGLIPFAKHIDTSPMEVDAGSPDLHYFSPKYPGFHILVSVLGGPPIVYEDHTAR